MGTAQIFPADEATAQRLPSFWTSAWMIEIDPGERFVYFIQRIGTPVAFRTEFGLARPVALPANWGWDDIGTEP